MLFQSFHFLFLYYQFVVMVKLAGMLCLKGEALLFRQVLSFVSCLLWENEFLIRL